MIANLIINARTDPNVWGGNPPKEFTYWRYTAMLCAQMKRPLPPPFSFAKTQGYVLAVVNYGRWCTVCPDPHCNNGMVLSHDDPVFWCTHCRMKWNEGLPCRVMFPRDYAEIELALSMRRWPEFRNWEPGESLAQVAQVNLEHKEDLYALV